MLTFLTMLAGGLMLATVAGCDNRPVANEPDNPAPGTLLNPEERGEVDVRAPGVDVGVNRDGDGDVEVRAPGVDIDVE